MLSLRCSTLTSPSIAPSPSSSSPPRPAVILPGLGNNSTDYAQLAATLEKGYGVPCVVAEVSRFDWLRNAAGLLDGDYWRGRLRPRPLLDWYLKRVDRAVAVVKAKVGVQDESVTVIGHSAGGWLARVYMDEFTSSGISLLLTLGTPHLPPPANIPGVIDQTRGLLNYVQHKCAPAVYTPNLRYVCVSGRYIRGARFRRPYSNTDSSDGDGKHTTPSWRAQFIGQGYKQVCGEAEVWGDGVVPEASAHLEGALNVSFDGVYHSPVGSDDNLRPWYGSPSVVQKWVHHLLQ